MADATKAAATKTPIVIDIFADSTSSKRRSSGKARPATFFDQCPRIAYAGRGAVFGRNRHRSSPTLDRHGIYDGLDLAAADRAPPAKRELAACAWVASKGWIPAWLRKAALRDDCRERPRLWVESGPSQETNGLLKKGASALASLELED
jgi:hypothetical protein